MMKTLSQEYANTVYQQVQKYVDKPEGDKPEKERKQYGAMAHKLPILVRQAGLLQAITFVYTRGKPGHTNLLKDLAQTVCKNDPESFLGKCRTDELSDYIWLTRKTLAALEWYKRFAESVLGVKASDDGGEDE
ncbi:MAG: type III-B CRISPR module-associated protein Cmr5 [Anaerolineales bacterium]